MALISTASDDATAQHLFDAVERMAGGPVAAQVRLWDGTTAGRPGPVAVLERPEALRWLLYRPTDLGIARAYVNGDLDIDGSLIEFLREVLRAADRSLDDIRAMRVRPTIGRIAAGLGTAGWMMRSGLFGMPLHPPGAEVSRRGLRGAQAVRHHYDLSNEFYRLMLGPSMVYSCAVWADTDDPADLDEAQRAKLDRICQRLQLRPGMRLLDIGCGWGALVVHAAQHYGVDALGVTLAGEQVAYAREFAERSGVADRVEIRQSDFRDVTDGPFDAVSSIEMTFHLTRRGLREHADTLYGLLAPGGRAFVHDVNASRKGQFYQRVSEFLTSYIFPEIDIPTLSALTQQLERAGLEIDSVENLRMHFAASHRAWLRNLEQNWDAVVAEIGLQRARAWRMFTAISVVSCEMGLTGVTHTVARRPEA
ncbi:class I SAM-dependent methyltransferase [Nocardia sp. NPDC049526]|uniref:class I SAM-dependent methyltransferase n=1 Tax=Nocardia sp. NPDC049526 TaxID=3364316 RepID=UPI00379BE65C